MTESVRQVVIMSDEWYPVYVVYPPERVDEKYGTVVSIPERTLERWGIVNKLFEAIQEEMREYVCPS